ncbi:MAG TPA: chemotaxis protein CheB [Verrucomicrobiae bacterium]|nr:chemotaxis protein CheB [Verrucomicrobiae bacterium]
MKGIGSMRLLKKRVSAKSFALRPLGKTVGAVKQNHEELELKNHPLSFPIVGIGASAGGLEAFTELLRHLPADTGMGFVLVQHLDPQHESALTQLLGRATAMPAREVTDNLRVEANHVYVIPPNTSLAIKEGVLKLQARPPGRMPSRSIDSFFESLARDQHERAIGVILSGTATDGTIGLEAIKAEGGIAFAQDESARYDSMPRNAIAAGCVDFVFSPENIAKELARIAKHPGVAGRMAGKKKNAEEISGALDETAGRPAGNGEHDAYKKILLLLRNHSGADFSLYKSATIRRRIARRMVLNKIESLEGYAHSLRGNAKELDALYSDCLISVTGFFRNPEAFEVLKRKIIPRLLQQRNVDTFRVWVPGCSTGQEAYSIAMVFMEEAEKFPRPRKLQIFATDLNETLLDRARNGLYARNVVQDASPERLRRFFVEEEGGYRITKQLREMVVFARQNLISDPPFSRMDLISCRNLLIYLELGLQKQVLPTFHYALKPEGFLFLGASESIGSFTDLFEPADKKQKIYSRKSVPTPAFHLPMKKRPLEIGGPAGAPRRGQRRSFLEGPEGFRSEVSAQIEADRVTVNQFAPPGVLINNELQILQFRGPAGRYLQPPAGKASFDVLKMTREGLMLPLRAAINTARKENEIARRENVRFDYDGKIKTVSIEVVPLKNLKERCFLVLFEDGKMTGAATPSAPADERSAGGLSTRGFAGKRQESRRIAELERELAETRDYLQAVQEQHEATNEELQASSEEVTSANEELQSVNEELETSKEELESANEELTTVNEEMSHRNAELSHVNADLNNLQTSTRISVILVGRDLSIRRFSPAAGKQFNLLAADIGQPLGRFRHNLIPAERGSPAASALDLEAFARGVIDTVREGEYEARDRDGHWFCLRAYPYLTLENKVDGAVIVFVDIEALKRTEKVIKASRDYAEATIRTARDPFLVPRGDQRVNSANEAFYKTFKATKDQTEGRLIYELGNRQWDIPKLRNLLEDVLLRNSFFDDFEVTQDFPHIGRRTMLLNFRRMNLEDGSPPMILLSIEDVTERLESRAALRESEQRYRTLFELNPVAVYTIDTAGVIQNYNPHAAELWGRQPMPGDTDERFCGSYKMFRPDGTFMPHEQCPMAEVVSGKIDAARDAEVHIDRPDGSRIAVVVNIRPLKNDRGEVVGAINCFYDITGRKRAEEARARLAALVEFSEDAIISKDLNGVITSWNQGAERLFGYREKEAVGQPVTLLNPLDRADEHSGILERICRGKAVQHHETVRRRKDGSLLDISLTVSPIRNSQREIIGASIIARDVTQNKRAEKELAEILAREQAANRAKDDFLAALSHELRTPLNPALLLASDSAADPDLPPQIRANFETIRKNIELEARLIDDLLDMTRITHDKLLLNQSELDVHEILKDAISNVFNEIEHKLIVLKLELRAESHAVFGDPVRLQQVFWNVLKNAVKFTPEGGRITIESQTLPGGKILIHIADTGLGMSPDEIERIFGAFSQGSHRFGGLGLGLAISRALVELHSGSIRAASPGKGKGATFSIELPLIALSEKEEMTGLRPASVSTVEKKSGEHVHILLVEDHEPTRLTLARLLLQRRYEVTSADSCAQARSLMEKNGNFGLLISDIGLPDGSGYDLISEFQKKYGAKGIALTGYGTEQDVAKSQSSGFTAHLTKPVSVESLEGALAATLKQTTGNAFIRNEMR